MKNKLFLTVFCLSAFAACKKDEPTPTSNVPADPPEFSAYIRTHVTDSTTVTAVDSASINVTIGPYNSLWTTTTVFSGGWYVTNIRWLRAIHGPTPPNDSADFYINAIDGSRHGFRHFKAGQLIYMDTLTVADIYVH